MWRFSAVGYSQSLVKLSTQKRTPRAPAKAWASTPPWLAARSK
jgi:hypothetical protein